MSDFPTQSYLKEIFNYNEETGILKWKKTRSRIKIGQVAGTKEKLGYIAIMLDGVLYKAHFLIWIYVTGTPPQNNIDHINGIKNDNRFNNLREATQQQNCFNKKMQYTNKSGYKGVGKAGKKWGARIQINGNSLFLGVFDHKKDAAIAYNEAALKYFGQFAHLNEVH